MLFVAYCVDKENHLEVRMETRPDHLEFMKIKGDAVKLGGPALADDGETPIGSMIIFEDTDLAAARAWIAEDPYAKAGLFQSVTVTPWKHVVGEGL
ncbi:YciI family protein [Sneathiella chinensis]|uniref:YCII-related domain-containing protein n=1 Tax=Sneathiella chinensis TaxID=349750 RepID=A0ABQ5TZZ1_9PROT|nr:YciI family protein [Sneathiella chinensis]GLQ05038.1 hypothetical protein GCM10007924_02590 [Sneathiella chinensis]